MASCKVGYVYIVNTVLTKPPKPKFAICVCVEPGYFVWINTEARRHGRDQIAIPGGCHPLVRHNSYVDLSRVVAHPDYELEEAREFPCISLDLCGLLIDAIEGGLYALPQRQAEVVLANLKALYG